MHLRCDSFDGCVVVGGGMGDVEKCFQFGDGIRVHRDKRARQRSGPACGDECPRRGIEVRA